MQKNLNVQWQVAVCRTVAGVSCQDSATGVQPPTLVDAVASLASVPDTVVVELGYNDPEETFASSVDTAMAALTAKGATHVLWLTMREARGPYPALNQILAAEAAKWPQLQLVDWNALSASHPDWFQDDGVHLVDAGGVAMAHLIHGAVVALYTPLHVTTVALPAFRHGRIYTTALRAAGGTAPFRWRVSAGRPPKGLHILATGKVFGHPANAESKRFSVTVTDADGVAATGLIRMDGG
jgi:hypothetical protein